MKNRNFIIAFSLFIVLGIILLVIKQPVAATISLGFASMLGISLITLKIMERNKLNKLDDLYYVLRKEELLKEYSKLTKEFSSGKLKAVTLMYLKFKREYTKDELKKFGLWLTKNYPADPSGIDGGIVVLFVNIHELMIKELMKNLKNELKEAKINVEFNYGYAYYEQGIEYEDLKTKALNGLKPKNN